MYSKCATCSISAYFVRRLNIDLLIKYSLLSVSPGHRVWKRQRGQAPLQDPERQRQHHSHGDGGPLPTARHSRPAARLRGAISGPATTQRRISTPPAPAFQLRSVRQWGRGWRRGRRACWKEALCSSAPSQPVQTGAHQTCGYWIFSPVVTDISINVTQLITSHRNNNEGNNYVDIIWFGKPLKSELQCCHFLLLLFFVLRVFRVEALRSANWRREWLGSWLAVAPKHPIPAW